MHRYKCLLLTSVSSDGDDLLATASGDQSIRIWDLKASLPASKFILKGHSSSVKAVKFRPGSQNELVSGAREGNIFLWDTRSPDKVDLSNDLNLL
jgi:WD40 repeat protein